MIKKKTKYTSRSPVISAIVIMIVMLFSGFSIWGLCVPCDWSLKVICIFWLVSLFVSLLGSMIGTLSGKRKIKRQTNTILKRNPYIYFRELPNDFGVGVTSLLIDSTLENYKDVVAVILDLCAKKYLNLRKENDKYVVTVLKDIDSGLLTNEKYILELLKNNDIKNINYDEWFNHCAHDGFSLNLFYHDRMLPGSDYMPFTDEKIKKRKKVRFVISLVIAIFVFLVRFQNGIIEAFMSSMAMFAISLLFLCVLGTGVNVLLMLVFFAKGSGDISYKKTLNNNLIRTSVGELEFQKVISFKNFLDDFGAFASKNSEEVILWDRYLSYAQLFGLTKKIMKSGYKQLVDNASFRIDDIDNINFDNIEVVS